MDLLMPGMDGYQAIEEIMRVQPTPILVLSAKANRNQVHTAFESMRRGAVDVLPKPEDTVAWRQMADSLPQMLREIVGSRRRAVTTVPARRARPRPEPPPAAAPAVEEPRRDLRWLLIGASTGGPAAVCDLLAALPPRPPVTALVVQHISPGFELGLVDWLASELPLDVRVARDGETPPPGVVRLAPPGAHLHLTVDGVLELDRHTPPWRSHRPSVDELFFSAARACPMRTAAALLTGMGTDGVQGLAQLAHDGALTYVQDEATAVVYGMPRAALERGAALEALPPKDIGRRIARHFQRQEMRQEPPRRSG
jgi:two-component system chemotaxis response regulator CheB